MSIDFAHKSRPRQRFRVALKSFSWDLLGQASFLLITGRRESGRTTLIRSILQNVVYSDKSKFQSIVDGLPQGVVIARSSHDLEAYQGLLQNSQSLTETRFQSVKTVTEDFLQHQAFIVLDNLCYSKDYFDTMRHLKSLRVASMSYLPGMNVDSTQAVEWLFILSDCLSCDSQRFYSLFDMSGLFPTLRIFEKVIRIATREFKCLVIQLRQGKAVNAYQHRISDERQS